MKGADHPRTAAIAVGDTENMMRVRSLVSVGLGLTASLLPLSTVLAQRVDPIAPLPPPAARRARPSQPAAAAPGPAAAPRPRAPPVAVLPPPVWQPGDVAQLAAYIRGVGREGLDPADYDPAGLDARCARAIRCAWSAAATERFNKLSSDLALGHVRGDARVGWHIVDKDLDDDAPAAVARPGAGHAARSPRRSNGLLPTHPQYGALRYALEVTPKTETAKLNRIRLNMDRWRWLPRDLGQKYIIVNVPDRSTRLWSKTA